MDQSPFATIAPELRTYIYESCLIFSEPIILTQRGHNPSTARSNPTTKTALLQTCKQINKECGQLFYANNSFVAKLGSSGLATGPIRYGVYFFELWYSSLESRNAAALRDVTIDVHNTEFVRKIYYIRKFFERILDVFGGRNSTHDENEKRHCGIKVRLSYLDARIFRSDDDGQEICTRVEYVPEIDLRNLVPSLKNAIDITKKQLETESGSEAFMNLSHINCYLVRVLRLYEVEVVGKEERERRDAMKRALGLEV